MSAPETKESGSVEMVPRAFMEMERDRAEMYRDQLAHAQQKILQQKARLRELERLQADADEPKGCPE